MYVNISHLVLEHRCCRSPVTCPCRAVMESWMLQPCLALMWENHMGPPKQPHRKPEELSRSKPSLHFFRLGGQLKQESSPLTTAPSKGLMSLPSFVQSPAFETDHKTASNLTATWTGCLKSPSAEAKLNLPSSTLKCPKAHFLPCPLFHTHQLEYLSPAEGSFQQRAVISLAAPNWFTFGCPWSSHSSLTE